MRIALISTPFVSVPPRKYGGTELMVHELAEGLVRRGHEVTLFGTGDSTTAAELRWLYPEAQWPPNLMADVNHVTWAMQQVREDGEYDVVHANSAPAIALTRFVPTPPMVYTVHHVREPELSSLYEHFPDIYYAAISRDQARREIQLPRLEVVHHGLDPERYQCRDRGGDYVCFIARFSRVKGPHTAIDVAGAAGVPIRVAGEVHGADAEFARREVEPRLERDHVTFLGSTGMREKIPLLRDARALLAPIEWNEPFGLALIEAMLSGCPVVAFPRGSATELVEHGVTGFLARDAAHMRDLIRYGGPLDDFDRWRCRERAAERFGRDRMTADYERLYERAVSEARPSAPLARIA
ncbi:MAG TPA: glycosyltransferase family 4 protein [Gemmatimonadaceae bacterium]